MDKHYLDHKIKKIKLKQSELNHLSSMISHYSTEIETKILKILETNNINKTEIYNLTNQSNNNIVLKHEYTCNSSPNFDFNPDLIQDFIATVYKQLILITHPDKNIDIDNDDFIQIKKAYDENDIYSLIEYSIKYNLMENSFNNLDMNIIIVILERKILAIKNKINMIKSTLGYKLLIIGNIDSYITDLKMAIKMRKENEEINERINKLQKNSGY